MSKGRKKCQEEIEDIHELFKSFIQEHRAYVNIDKVATGEIWLATKAKELNLVDELQTSDDYLLSASKDHDIYSISIKEKKPLGKRIMRGSQALLDRFMYGDLE